MKVLNFVHILYLVIWITLTKSVIRFSNFSSSFNNSFSCSDEKYAMAFFISPKYDWYIIESSVKVFTFDQNGIFSIFSILCQLLWFVHICRLWNMIFKRVSTKYFMCSNLCFMGKRKKTITNFFSELNTSYRFKHNFV